MTFYRGEEGSLRIKSGNNIVITQLADNERYEITAIGDDTGNPDNWTAIGAANPAVGLIFTKKANVTGEGTGTAKLIGKVLATRSWQLSIEREALEALLLGTDNVGATNISGPLRGVGSAEVMYQGESGATEAFLHAAKTGGEIYAELYLEDSKYITTNLVMTSSELTATVGELSVITVNFVTSGDIDLEF